MGWRNHPQAMPVRMLIRRFCGEHNCPTKDDALDELVEAIVNVTADVMSPLEATETLIRKVRNPSTDIDKLLGSLLIYKASGGVYRGKFYGD